MRFPAIQTDLKSRKTRMEHKKTDQFLQQHMMLNLGALHLQGDHVGAFGQFSGVGLAYSTPSPLLHQEKIVKGSKKKKDKRQK